MSPIIQHTKDGSHTLYLSDMQETYHSHHGAITESIHVFIENGFFICPENPIKILEVGFGTGLNAWLTAMEAEKFKKYTNYHSYELYPLDEIVNTLNYPEKYSEITNIPSAGNAELFHKIHHTDWNISEMISEYFILEKIQKDITKKMFEPQYHLIYFDAFAPQKQPEMWTENIFINMHRALCNNGILVTYCSKGDVRRLLQKTGFVVEKLPGPPGGKREMLRARKNG